jgi:uncharacterized membrane protein (DUF2068 family)
MGATEGLPDMNTPATSPGAATRGVRLVALLEAAKAAVVVVAGFGLLVAVHEGAAHLADALVGHLHLNPARSAPRIFIDLARDAGNAHLRLLAAGAFAYALIRACEAYGLWHGRRWALWLSVASGAVYVPFEAYALATGFDRLKLAMLLVNLGVVVYMAVELRFSRQRANT